MAAIRSRNTKPEMIVRSIVHGLGYRYRLHDRDLPGSPDLVFPRLHAAIFVHGCFWHGHRCQRRRKKPSTNAAYWLQKVRRNQRRDRRVTNALLENDWRLLIIWECEVKRPDLIKRLQRFLDHADRRTRPRGPATIIPRR